jgi:hypothetical protein
LEGYYVGGLDASLGGESPSGRSATSCSFRALAIVVLSAAVLVAGTGSARAAGSPQIKASWVENVFSSSATLKAEVNANGLKTSVHFEYISEAGYQANLDEGHEGFSGAASYPLPGKEIGIGEGVGYLRVGAIVSPLTPVTTYRYRPIATNSAGPVIGPDHVFTTGAFTNVYHVPDGRQWELVSPADKGGSAIQFPESIFGGGDFQAADVASAITYSSTTAFGQAEGAPPASQYVSRRTPSGWITENISAPLDSAAYGDEPDGAPYRVFSASLSRALLFGGLACRGGPSGCPTPNPVLSGAGAPEGWMAYYLRNNETGDFASLLSASDVAHTAVSKEDFEVAFAGASPDLSHVVLSSCAALTPDAEEVTAPGGCIEKNLYEWSEGALKAINLLPGHAKTTPGALLAAPIGAMSDDGARVYLTQLEDGPIYLREGTQSKEIPGTVGELAEFQTASSDGLYAFYTKGGHLYRWDAKSEASKDLTPLGGVQGVLGASRDGTYAYYQDGDGIKQWHIDSGGIETTTTVATGANAAKPSDYPPSSGTARVSPDGQHLAFLSAIELDGHDNLDANTGLPDTEVYLYGPLAGAPELICASCNPKGERPDGSASIPGAPANGSTAAYKPRALSADGLRILFDSEDDLVTGDTNSRSDVYQWEALGHGDCVISPGCINLISKGSAGSSTFLDASANGDDAYFITDVSLVNDDPGSIDVYDAKAGGGFPEPKSPIACIGDACQSLPGEPEDPTPGTLVPNPGNQKVRYLREHRRKKLKPNRRHHHRRHHKSSGGKRR